MNFVPVVIEFFISLRKVQIRHIEFGRHKIKAVDTKRFFRYCRNTISADIARVGKHDLTPALEIARIAVKIFKSHIHNRALSTKNVLPMVGKKFCEWRKFIW